MPAPPTLRVLTWNLFHGRALPGVQRSLLDEFAALIAGWDWDVALLQEVPPWWPPALARAAGAEQRTSLTSRNQALALRRALAARWPETLKSGAGGANAILARRPVVAHAKRRLRLAPERRTMHAVRIADGTWIANLHASANVPARAVVDVALAQRTALRWAARAPLVVGGDFNLRERELDPLPGFVAVAGHSVDHVLARGLARAGPLERPARGPLSDHEPLIVTLRRAAQ